MENYFNLRGGFCTEEKPESCGIIIFGASGDLTHRKLIPALFRLFQRDLLADNFFILGCARSEMTDEEFRQKVRDSIENWVKNITDSDLDNFIRKCYYNTGEDYQDKEMYDSLVERLQKLDEENSTGGNHIFHFALPPKLYSTIVEHLGICGLAKKSEEGPPFPRVIVEKPYGHDLESAIELDEDLRSVFAEKQIYRIDHYLGKETVQNILMFRFANAVFEPIWNRRYIDHVQITVAESIGIEKRAGYFEQTGLLRDMFQNHMLQMLALVAMEPSISFDADRIRDEKVKLLRSIRPFPLDDLDRCIVRGQYGSGLVDGSEVVGYRQEEGVDSDSQVETFVAAKVLIENWRWQGVPFYMRAGKRLARRVSEIAIIFKRVPYSMFAPLEPEELSPNVLALNVQPEEGVSLTIQAKQPGAKLCMTSLTMDFRYQELLDTELPDAYERLLLDCMLGDQTLFWRSDGIEASWSLVTPVLKRWEKNEKICPITFYKSGSWGPSEAEALLKRDGRKWREL
jgi:glucose-6-phosphate 1-dehydrogenase